MYSKTLQSAIGAVLLASLAACGGGGGTSGATPPPVVTPQLVATPLIVSDASSEDWAMIGVKVLAITLTQQGGAVTTAYTAASPTPVTNLAALDNIGELLASAAIPAGTYTSASGSAAVVSITSPGLAAKVAASWKLLPMIRQVGFSNNLIQRILKRSTANGGSNRCK